MAFVRHIIWAPCSMWWCKLFTFNTLNESLLRFMSTAALAFHLFKTIGIILSAELCCRCLNWAALWRRARFLWQQTELSRWDHRWSVRYAGARCSSSISMSRKHWKVVTYAHSFTEISKSLWLYNYNDTFIDYRLWLYRARKRIVTCCLFCPSVLPSNPGLLTGMVSQASTAALRHKSLCFSLFIVSSSRLLELVPRRF